ncbi:MAG TPA: tetratricopeptide repeat protein, partial [Burkholderiales bacterium]|nr:tetratricopeptide repeat protein [Burkholderiales bacterium]
MFRWLKRGRDADVRRLLEEGAGHAEHGRADEAERAFNAALAADPGNPYALFNLGRIDFLRGRLPDARAHLTRALDRQPGFADAHILLASAQEALGELAAAQASLESALRVQPDHEGALQNLGLLHVRMGDLLFAQGRFDDAGAHYGRAAACRPSLAGAHAGQGQVHAVRHEPAEAARCFGRAIELDPHLVHVHVNLGNALANLGSTDEARASYDAALALDPENAAARWCRAVSVIPAIRESADETQRSRAAFAREIAGLETWFDATRAARGAEVVGLRQPFWLAYQEERNADLLGPYGRLCSRLMQASAGPDLRASPRPTDGRLRLAVVSRQFRRHSVWQALVRGWFEHLDPGRFELLAFSLGADADEETRYAKTRAARFE